MLPPAYGPHLLPVLLLDPPHHGRSAQPLWQPGRLGNGTPHTGRMTHHHNHRARHLAHLTRGFTVAITPRHIAHAACMTHCTRSIWHTAHASWDTKHAALHARHFTCGIIHCTCGSTHHKRSTHTPHKLETHHMQGCHPAHMHQGCHPAHMHQGCHPVHMLQGCHPAHMHPCMFPGKQRAGVVVV